MLSDPDQWSNVLRLGQDATQSKSETIVHRIANKLHDHNPN